MFRSSLPLAASFYAALAFSVPWPAIVLADGTVSGTCRFEKIKGRPSAGYIGLYEWNNFLSADGGFVDGQSYRCGHQFGGGTYNFTSAAGGYTMYVSQPLFFARPKIVNGVQILDNQTRTVNPELAIDYSCYVTNDWSWDYTYYQTFRAIGTSITRLQWRLAGWNTDTVEVSVHRSIGGNVTTWPQVGPTKSAPTGYGDAWTAYRSGDISLVPGETYAIRLRGVDGDFGIMSRVEDGNGYAQGQAFDRNGNGQNRDLNITVFTDNDGTVIPYAKTTPGLGSLAHWEGYWGQTFKATGSSLAAADLWFASTNWNIKIRFRVYTGDPGGPRIGPSKIANGASQTAGVGLIGYSWAPDEVPLVIGGTYYIEMMAAGGAGGFTPYQFDRSVDDYPDGHAYAAGTPRTDIDLSMTIMEYAGESVPSTIVRNPTALWPTVKKNQSPPNDTFTVRNGGGGLLSYTITDDVDWLEVTPTGGDSGGEADLINVVYDTSELALGSHIGTITIDAPDATNTPQTVMVYLTVKPQGIPGDMDSDLDVDQEDYGLFQLCLTALGVPQEDPICADARLDGDNDVDQQDLNIFLGCMTPPGVPGNASCDQ